MKMNKKGFTLIELLAVIVILAIIMLIATPLILNVINDARKGAARSSAMGYIDAIEKKVLQDQVLDETVSLDFDVVDPDLIKVRGEKPASVSLKVEGGEVTNGEIKFGNFVFIVTGGNVALSE